MRAALLLAALALPSIVQAAAPPAGTALPYNNIGAFDAGTGSLQSCVTIRDAQGKPQTGADGKPQVFDVRLQQQGSALVFRLLDYTPFNLTAGQDCSGSFKGGVYTDSVLVNQPGLGLNGAVVAITLEYIPGTNLEFRLRTDAAAFGIVRNLKGNTTALGSNLGDFQQVQSRDYGTTNLPASIGIRLPTCSDAQGDDTRVVLEQDGVVIAGAALPGGTYPLATAALAVGEYTFRSRCSDETGVRNLFKGGNQNANAAWFAASDYAPGTLKIRIVNGTATGTGTGTAGSSGTLAFQFDSATSAGDQQLIRQAAGFAKDFFAATFGRTLQKATTVSSSTTAQGCALGSGAAAFTGPQTVTFCTGNSGWTDLGPLTRQKVVIHEVFHLLQFELRWLGNQTGTGPHWLTEGAAEYVAWLGIANQGSPSLDTARGCMLKEVADFALQKPPGLPNLDALATRQAFSTPGPVYPLAMLGADRLAGTAGNGALLTYGTALAGGADEATAFQAAFGTPLATFYTQFPAYKASLTVPATYQCRL